MRRDFLLAVLTMPGSLAGEADLLEGLLEAGLQKLHLRKPGVEADYLERLLEQLSPRWGHQLVLHGHRELAERYGISQIHGPVRYRGMAERSGGGGKEIAPGEGIAVSTSVHFWEEAKELPGGLAYAFLSPVFDSISKPGYKAHSGLLQRPAGSYPCPMIGMGGVGEDRIAELVRHGWDGAAILGWIWEEPREAVNRFFRVKKIVDERE
jgi:thiamine-phosphate pyrophosphorylase